MRRVNNNFIKKIEKEIFELKIIEREEKKKNNRNKIKGNRHWRKNLSNDNINFFITLGWIKEEKRRHLKDIISYRLNFEIKKIKEIVLERDNFKCVLCNNKEILCLHHVDKNRYNNLLENLLILCNHCHNKLHSIRSKIQSEK